MRYSMCSGPIQEIFPLLLSAIPSAPRSYLMMGKARCLPRGTLSCLVESDPGTRLALIGFSRTQACQCCLRRSITPGSDV